MEKENSPSNFYSPLQKPLNKLRYTIFIVEACHILGQGFEVFRRIPMATL